MRTEEPKRTLAAVAVLSAVIAVVAFVLARDLGEPAVSVVDEAVASVRSLPPPAQPEAIEPGRLASSERRELARRAETSVAESSADGGLRSVSGVVLSADGQPAGDVVVKLMRHILIDGTLALTRSGRDGSFRFASVEPGDWLQAEYKLESWRPDLSDGGLARLEDVAPGAHDLVLRLDQTPGLAGIVRDSRGTPIEEFDLASVAVDTEEFRRVYKSCLDPGGAFSLRFPCEGEGLLAVTAPDHGTVRTCVGVPCVTPLEIVLPASTRLRGRVLDADGRPTEATVAFPSEPGLFWPTDADGSFDREVPGGTRGVVALSRG